MGLNSFKIRVTTLDSTKRDNKNITIYTPTHTSDLDSLIEKRCEMRDLGAISMLG